MTLKEEAKEIYSRMEEWVTDAHIYKERGITSITAKQCALVHVDKLIEYINNSIKSDGIINHVKGLGEIVRYRELKQEIEKL